MAARFHKSSNAMFRRRSEARLIDFRSCRIGKHSRGRHTGKRCLADAPLTRKQPGMVQGPAFPGRCELLDSAVLADNHGSRSARASMSFAVTFSGDPEALIRRTRSGSVAAMVRKAVSTFR
jgi:hypothetical protein